MVKYEVKIKVECDGKDCGVNSTERVFLNEITSPEVDKVESRIKEWLMDKAGWKKVDGKFLCMNCQKEYGKLFTKLSKLSSRSTS